ncbi:MAG TPA: translocation/assembly module TamB domain-containing protein [Acidobacteriota bacterium]|nr:translocation/assembly module TamB domain-containing protein [Acidobacteriota bacterium]
MRRWKKVLIVAVVLAVVLVGAGYSYFFHLGGLERTINRQIAGRLGEDSPVSVRVGEIKGSLFSGVVVQNVIVTYADSLYNYRLATVASLTAGYSFSNLWRKNYIFDYVYVDSAIVTLVKDGSGRLVVPSFTGEGDSARSLDVVVDELHLDRCRLAVVGPYDTIDVRDLTLLCAVRSEKGTYSASIKQLAFDSNVEDLRLTAASGNVTFTGKDVAFQDITLVSGETRLKANGTVDVGDGSGQVDFAADRLDVAAVSRVMGANLRGILDVNGTMSFGEAGLAGTVDLGGDFLIAHFDNLVADFRYVDRRLTLDTLYGTILGNCAVDGRGTVDLSGDTETYHLAAEIKDFNLERLVASGFASDLTGRISLDGRSFQKDAMVLDIDMEFMESMFGQYPIQYALGSVRLTRDSLRFRDSFRIDYYENRFSVTGKIDFRNDIELAVEVDLDNLDRYRGKLFIDQPGGRGVVSARLSGRTADPDLSGTFTSDSLWLYGLYADTAVASFDIARFLTGKYGYVQTRFLRGSAWQAPYDSAFVRLTLDSTRAFIDSVCFSGDFTSAVARGMLDWGVDPQRLVLDTFSLSILERAFYNRSSIRIAIDSTGFEFERASIGDDTAGLSVTGRINYDETMDLALAVERVPVAPWMRLRDEEFPFDGYLSCEASLTGSIAAPRFSLYGAVDSLTYKQLTLGDLTLIAGYENRRLTIDSFVVLSDPGVYRATGYLYLDLAFTADSLERVLDEPFDLHVTARDNRFDLVSLFMPSVEQLEGDFFADVRIGGKPSAPHLEGRAYLNHGMLKYYDLADSIFTDSAGVTMQDNRIIIEGVTAYVKDRRKGGRRSYAEIEGVITVKSLENFHYDLDVTLQKEFPFKYDLDDIDGVVEGELHIEGDTPPLVTGDLTLISIMYRANFASADEGSPIMAAFSGENTWDLNINVDILSNYWIKNDDIDAEFSGFMNLIRENGRYRFVGEMDILRGRGFLFDKTFRIEPYSQVIFEGTEYPNPRLDITAYTRIPGVSFQEEERQDFTELGIHVTGTLENPEFNTTADDTTFTREDILPLIVANYYGGQAGSAGRFEQRMTQLISSQVSRIGSQQLSQLGVETFEIDPAYGGENGLTDTRVTLGFYTGPNLYIYGRSALSGQRGQALGFEYRFSRSLLLEGRRDEEELYHLNLNLHWEF